MPMAFPYIWGLELCEWASAGSLPLLIPKISAARASDTTPLLHHGQGPWLLSYTQSLSCLMSPLCKDDACPSKGRI